MFQENEIDISLDKKEEMCQICLDPKLVSESKCCKFKSCSECMAGYLISEINSKNSIKIECPNTGCNREISHYEITHMLASNNRITLKKYLQNVQNAKSLREPNCKACPQCSNPAKLMPQTFLDKVKHRSRGQKIVCNECQHTWCFRCHAPWHENKSCKKYQKEVSSVKTWAKAYAAGQKNAQLCPKCKVWIQRNQGCDHMTCVNCRTEFCYRCGSKYRSVKFLGKLKSKLYHIRL